ncbi:hypothetical protein RGRSB_1010 [cyanobacterium endosymbiont of Rhopalodia gibberula]|uniref:hypothetical protein n=1 Tax=cyanobacterium endosymbiont of Rhopalodia gibberula TaxID=1763363 RepID=UPI000DC7262F|nr:hypothetical protein [cyanobacterium endosymbiont of Rhopalodia gibberula]BBA79512.1 hypothetical protein RGRSB_1010 [cyanobacterium endosymbiont of Rhopalodia gibberula]
MASEAQVKHYLAHWFQLGKQVLLPKRQQKLCPSQIFAGNTYSREFESYWQYISAAGADCYLEGAGQTIRQLLSPEWEVVKCTRCQMPCPVAISRDTSSACLCVDLPSWPNTKLPSPRVAIDNQIYLARIQQRLARSSYD